MTSPTVLTPFDHSRDSAGLAYVYPVVSRRAGGVSVGINLNPNNACNWRCIYCQVPDLRRGSAPPVDLARLERELRGFLDELLHGRFMEDHVPEGMRRLNDIALSGNGEPTSAAEFDRVVELIGRVMADFGLTGRIRLVLITNGSLVRREAVVKGLREMARLGGEVWFKLDSATPEGRFAINGTRQSVPSAFGNLRICASLCPTWLQTAVFAMDGQPPSPRERDAYLAFLKRAKEEGVPLSGVLLYGLARPSRQPGAARLSAVPQAWLEEFAAAVRALGVPVTISG
ncbi:MAG: radical SAM protein [Pseudomonadota bacterium]